LKKSFYFLFSVVLLFSACGGGGSSDSTPTTSSVIPILSIPANLTITKNVNANNAVIIENRGSQITSCEVSPDLPTGLTLNNDCTISGTASEDTNGTLYTFTATNASGTNTVSSTIEVAPSINATVTGTITYDSVPLSGNSGLQYNSTVQKLVRGATLEIIDVFDNVLGTTETDGSGEYSVTVDGTMAKVRVQAKLYKAPAGGASSWDFQVKDNTNSNALYVMEGSLASLSQNSRNLNAPSGWGGSSYSSTRTAAPFAILDVVYQAIQKVTTAQNDAVFPALNIFWSKNNINADGDRTLGQIITSHYDPNANAFYILGKENTDTDEYDVAVVAHEWSHYYEDKFSRSDSIGGLHSGGDMLDIRLAFGEGFGTAMGCMIIDSPLYIDSYDNRQGLSWGDNLEAGGSRENPGWYSEASIYSVLYDIYDSNDDTNDTLSLGFTPIHNLLIDAQKNTEAFTSIFTFITALKDENPGNDDAIDAITSYESIEPITDINGTGRTNRRAENANPLYASLSVGGSVNVTMNYSSVSSSNDNKLGVYSFIIFTVPSTQDYTIGISKSAGSGTPDPDMYLYFGASNLPIATATAAGASDSMTVNLDAGTYRMAITDDRKNDGITFEVTLN